MSNINHIEDKLDEEDGGEEYDKVETKRVIEFLKQQVRRANIGTIIKIMATELLKSYQTNEMKYKYVYVNTSSCENICEVTFSRTFQNDWSI